LTDVTRAPESTVREFDGLRSCDISDVMRRAGTMVGIRRVYTPMPAALGTAITVSVPFGGVNMIKLAMEQTRPGDVLVVAAHGVTEYALWGGNLTRGLKARGVRALVVDGAIRDVTEIQAEGYSMYARGVATAVGGIDSPWGEVNVPVACGGVVVQPGDIVVADDDGIVVVPPDEASEIAAATRELMAKHESAQPTLLRGEVTSIDEITRSFLAAGLATVTREPA